MMRKQQAITMHRPWPHNGFFKSHLREIFAHLKQMVEIPIGYEDATGFHAGAEPARAKIQWPPA